MGQTEWGSCVYESRDVKREPWEIPDKPESKFLKSFKFVPVRFSFFIFSPILYFSMILYLLFFFVLILMI